MAQYGDDEELLGPLPNPSLLARGRMPSPAKSGEASLESLRTWTEQWEFQPGTQYIKVDRRHPSSWEGIPIQGFLEDVCEPFDEDYLGDTWGGGTYRLSAVQLNSQGNMTTVARKSVTISGVPIAFRGRDGEPHALPESSRLRQAQEDMGEEDPLPYRGHGQLDSVDLYNLVGSRRDAAAGGVDSNVLDVLRSAQADSQAALRAVMESQRAQADRQYERQQQELDRLRAEATSQQAQSARPMADAMSLVEQRYARASDTHQHQMEQMRQSHQHQMDSMREAHREALRARENEISQLRTEYQHREANIRQTLTAHAEQQIRSLEGRLETQRSTFDRRLESAKADAAAGLDQQRLLLETTYETKSSYLQGDRDRLAAELAALQQECSALRAQVGQREDPIASLERMKSLIGTVQDFTGGPPEPVVPGGQAPDDLLGKIAHYGPGIAKNFLGPVLQRVDRVTEATERAIAFQEGQQGARPPAPYPLPPPGYPAPAPAPTPVPAPAPTPVPPRVPPTGGSPLLNLLGSEFLGGNSPEGAASALQVAVMSGSVPAEAITSLADVPDQTILTNLLAEAESSGFGDLVSPRGNRFLGDVLNLVRGHFS